MQSINLNNLFQNHNINNSSESIEILAIKKKNENNFNLIYCSTLQFKRFTKYYSVLRMATKKWSLLENVKIIDFGTCKTLFFFISHRTYVCILYVYLKRGLIILLRKKIERPQRIQNIYIFLPLFCQQELPHPGISRFISPSGSLSYFPLF